MSESSESEDEKNDKNCEFKDKNDLENNDPTSMIEYLAISLVKRAN